MIKFYYLSSLFLLFQLISYGQGKLMLVGGGAEDEGGWSDTPYQWAVENSVNKKVAVISYEDQDNFIPDYFLSLGAASANNIKIDSYALADLQSTYDSLMKYDVFFFKGGDQSIYYSNYKDTKTTQAVVDKFKEGGVITGTSAGMAILSNVIFTATNGSVYPDDCLKNYKQSSITLANDFLPLFDGFIFDTHFTERGRAARLISFMANWFDATGEFITGIGVDDRTALCIDENKTGTVYGTGTVSIFSGKSFQSYQDKKLIIDSIHTSQLLHGHTIDLKTLTITKGSENFIKPPHKEENGNYQIMLSGSEGISTNGPFINDFIHTIGNLTDTLVLVTAPGKATGFKQKLTDAAVPFIVVETSSDNNDAAEVDLRNAIRNSKKILFAENDDSMLFDFLEGGTTGALIAEHCTRNKMIVAFAGEDSRYAGETFSTNHLNDQYAAYYGSLQYKKGLGLLQSTVIMSNTYDLNTSDFYENTTAAIPFAMFTDSLKFGVYLNRNSYLKFYQNAGNNYFSLTGDLSGIVMINKGTVMEAASQPVDVAGHKRNYIGFSDIQYTFLNGDARLFVGQTKPSADLSYEYETTVGTVPDLHNETVNVFPNPSANGIFNVSLYQQYKNCTITVRDILGRLILFKPVDRDVTILDLNTYSDGIYLLKIASADMQKTVKVIKQQEMQ